jgi:TetR/AcrR family transcriptional repressor of lmrAB and yxaGH operons
MADKLPTRDRILRAARHLFQRRGYYAVGTAEILAAARAPKGSMYHHFPDGKEQIAVAAVESIRADVTAILRQLAEEDYSAAESIRALAKGMAQWLKASQWREGTMLASTTVGSVPDLPKVHAAIRNAFDEWRDHIVGQLVTEGWRKPAAHSMAQTVLAGIEGAMMLARIDQDERIVIRVAETLAGLIGKEPQTSTAIRL